jgi:hypothetical protein
MATVKDAAILSLYVYNAPPANTPSLPNWTRIEDRTEGTNGFAYAVFSGPGGEIVISYRGSDDGADWLANTGLTVSQDRQAAVIAAQYINQYGAGNVSFTGHSLGGGIAATMAVWFNRPAIVFDPAPTQNVATDPGVVNSIVGTLGSAAPASFIAYNSSISSQFSAREANVSSYYAPGSVVYSLTNASNTITGQANPVNFGIANMGSVAGRVDMHSQALLTAGILSPAFAQSTVAVQRALPVIFDKSLYHADPRGTARNFIIDLIRSEQTTPNDSKLDNFSEDLNRLGANLSALSIKAQDAIIAQGIEWYYWQGSNFAGQNFFINNGQSSLLQYTGATGAALPDAVNKATKYTCPINVYLTNPLVPGTAQFDTNAIPDVQTTGVQHATDLSPTAQVWTPGLGQDEDVGKSADKKSIDVQQDQSLIIGDGKRPNTTKTVANRIFRSGARRRFNLKSTVFGQLKCHNWSVNNNLNYLGGGSCVHTHKEKQPRGINL